MGNSTFHMAAYTRPVCASCTATRMIDGSKLLFAQPNSVAVNAIASGSPLPLVSPAHPIFSSIRRELDVKPGTNPPGVVNGREYTGHAFDRMQRRGNLPSLVEQAIRNGVATPSSDATIVFYDSANNLSVVVNEVGTVVTTSFGRLRGK